MHEELLGELAVFFELGHQFRDLVADGDGLKSDDVVDASLFDHFLRLVEVGEAMRS